MALCDSTDQLRRDHAYALTIDGGPTSRATGATVLKAFKNGCGAA